MRDDVVMRRAIEIARTARRHTAPKPAVGCVIVRDGAVVAAAATAAGPAGAHAEAGALAIAGEQARGATAVVTLEPCNHHANTPPCTEALIAAGVARVVVALEDPDPQVAGTGVARLRAAGIEVVVGVDASEAARDLAPYLHHRGTGRAFVTAKVAQSLDGRIAAADGTSQWITSPEARADAHELRADAQAIVVGAGTALADQPALTVRDANPLPLHPPLRVLLDARGRVPAVGPLFDTTLAPTLVVTTERASHEAVDAWRAAGAKVETVSGVDAGVDLDATFALLGRYGVLHALVEGGGTLLGSVMFGGQAQRLVAYIAPALIGAGGAPAFAAAGVRTIDELRRFALVDTRAVGPDVRLEYEMRA